MGLIIIYNIFLYMKALKKYKKRAKKDRRKLLELLSYNKIRIEDINDNNKTIILNKFINSRIRYYNISYEDYMKNIFPYLCRYLQKFGLNLVKKEVQNNENINCWKEI